MDIDFSGEWHNQLGSSMELQQDASGKVTGTYRTNVGTPSPTHEFEITGAVLNDILTFFVRWRNENGSANSVTSWVGQLTNDPSDNDVIHTFWHLASDVVDANEPTRLWAAVQVGADHFSRGPASGSECSSGRSLAPSHPVKFK